LSFSDIVLSCCGNILPNKENGSQESDANRYVNVGPGCAIEFHWHDWIEKDPRYAEKPDPRDSVG
jgi:hypothetical protein